MTDGIYQRLTAVFQNVFDEDDLVLTPQMSAADVEGWDSLNHIRLMLAVSKAFSTTFTAAEMSRLKNVGDLVALIEAKAPPTTPKAMAV